MASLPVQRFSDSVRSDILIRPLKSLPRVSKVGARRLFPACRYAYLAYAEFKNCSGGCYGLNCISSKPYVEVLTRPLLPVLQSVTLFGSGVVADVIS